MKKINYLIIVILFVFILCTCIFLPKIYMMITTSIGNSNNLTNTEGITREQFEAAFKEVAWAFYMRGEYISYNSLKTNTDYSIYSPEEATSQNINYIVCSAYSYYIYYNLFNIYIPHYTANLINYAAENKGKVGVVAYGKRKDENNLDLTIYDEKKGEILLKNPTLSEIIPHLQIGDVLTYTGHTIIVYELDYDETGNVIDAYIIESTHGNDGFKANTKINGNSNHYLYHNTRLSDDKLPIFTTNNEKSVTEGSLHIGKLSLANSWKELENQSYERDEYSIVRFAIEKENKMVLSYYGNDENGKIITLNDETKNRLKYSRLYIEKTVSEHNDDVVSIGDTLTYKIIVRNNSVNNYTDSIIVTENINDYVEYNGKYTTSNSNIKYEKKSNNIIQFTIPALASGEEAIVTYDVIIKENTIGKEIISTGKVANINSAIIRNIVGHNLDKNQINSIKNSYNSLIKNNLTGKNLINEIYNSIGLNIHLDTFDIKDLVRNTNLSNTAASTISLNNNNYLYKAILNKYYGSLFFKDNIFDLKLWQKYSNSTRRADTIYQENFKTGDILIYQNSNDYTTNENGDYAYIYIEGLGFVGKNPGRNAFNADYYKENNLKLYTNSKGNTNNFVSSDFLEFINYQTLLGKDYYVILRPSLLIKTPTKIEINNYPTKMSYLQNKENLDLTGGIINIKYDDGTNETINMNNDKFIATGFNNSKVGKNTITLKYLDMSVNFIVEITAPQKEVTKIELDTKPLKDTYIQNQEKLDLTGGVLKVTYDDKSISKIDINNEQVLITGFDNSKIGKNTISIKYQNKITVFDVEIISKEVSKIEVETNPKKITYIQNQEKLDLTGGVLKVTYNDESVSKISMINEQISVSGFNNTTIGNNIITLKYLNQATTFNVKIVEKQIINISIKKMPSNIDKIVKLDDTKLIDGILLIEYSDNSRQEINTEDKNVKVVDITKDNNKKTITIEYLGYQVPITSDLKKNNYTPLIITVGLIGTFVSLAGILLIKKKNFINK